MHPYDLHRSQQAAWALTSALSNPYGGNYNHHAPHYAQAYSNVQPSFPPYGAFECANSSMSPPGSLNEVHTPRRGQSSHHPQMRRGIVKLEKPRQVQVHWYEPGNVRCTHEQCTFTGARRSVEIHMMDRHLIYPPGWDKRKRRPDWDADPSLNNGKPVPIQGTNVILDNPETIQQWIDDRKKRWPTKTRIAEKTQKLKDAIARGEIAVTEFSLRGSKRPITDSDTRGQRQKRSRNSIREAPRDRQLHPLPNKPNASLPSVTQKSNDDDSSSNSDMDPEKDAISSKTPGILINVETDNSGDVSRKAAISYRDTESTRKQHTALRKVPRQPQPAPRGPIGARSSLLRKLLLPEIRMTISNLSQAIHFIVENDFLEYVELNPGEADKKPIEVVEER